MSAELQREAVDVLAAIRDHLDIPLYAEGDKKARRAWQAATEQRTADVIGYLDSLLAVRTEDALDVARELRALAAQMPITYANVDERGQQ